MNPAHARLIRFVRDAMPAPIVNAIQCADRLCDPHARRCYAQEGEDILLDRLLGGQVSGFYVDVGAHHPKRFSNTFLFYLRGWRGINIDPDPDAIALFDRVRPRDLNIVTGVAESAARLRYHCFSDAALNTFDAQLAAARERLAGYRLLGTREVEVERLDRLLAVHLPPGQPVDFLTVDVEGLDLQVLASNDWLRVRPRWVLVECLGTTLEGIGGDPVGAFMHSLDYEPAAKTLNTVFFRDRLETGNRTVANP